MTRKQKTSDTLANDSLTAIILEIPLNLAKAIWGFLVKISKNRSGFIGFLGLVAYFILTFILPSFIPFDDEANLDEITGPPGSRIQLAVHVDNADVYQSLEDLEGRVVGVVTQTGGPSFIAPYEDTLTVEEFRWSSRRTGPGIQAALTALANQEIDAMLIFSKSVDEVITNQEDPDLKALFDANIVISNPTLGPRHWLGSDTQGRDIGSHIVHGGRILILTAVLGGVISTGIALVFGSLGALLGGTVDNVLTALTNLILAIPRFPLLVVLAGLISFNNTLFLGVLIGVLGWPALMRAIRAQVLSLRERDFVEAAQSLGLGMPHIMFREILPNMISFVIINFIFSITFAMYEQIGLVVLGLAPISDYTWGVMLYFGRTRGTLFNSDGASMALSPVMAIALFQVCLVLFARALEELFDPRLRSGLV
ncbi:MAG: ABC transporter permease subunit [Anaerolineae bacterium]|nr:ABC transporter permease subunit [Anaerolineae bacterium]